MNRKNSLMEIGLKTKPSRGWVGGLWSLTRGGMLYQVD